jgi:UDP-glucose 4-epimerase
MGMSNWLVTGGCGFIGAAFTARLLRSGHRVRVLDDLSVGRREALPQDVPCATGAAALASSWPTLSLAVADIRDAVAIAPAFARADAVVHLAANTGVMPSIADPVADFDVNARGTLNCLEAARQAGVRRFIFASSSAPLGVQEPPISEDKVPRPVSPYGAGKLASEGYCSAYFGSFGLETVALRFGNVYGPGSGHKESVIAKLLRQALAGEVLEIYGDGGQSRDFVFIDDIVEALLRACECPGLGGELLHIATEREHTINEVVEIITHLVAERTGNEVAVRYAAARRGEVRRIYADISKARRLLDFSPDWSLAEGIEATLEYFLRRAASTAA